MDGLNPEHAKLVLENLEGGEGYSVEPFQDMLKLFPSSALYLCAGTDKAPAAWALCYHIGMVRMVFCKKEHRRKGLASVAINDLCRKWLSRYPEFVIMSATEIWNEASLAMHQKLGFEIIHQSKVLKITQ